ncbi:DUF2325 domain-containing protein [Acidovorax sp. NCPPB 4044]|uniref:DUF2325 domain-containing protein n=1 Tax=Acidovorax sp. NCPPB 4044 TaxID=2940490 RepID=UPI0023038A05|nr:DUF2325 domain-containing protein [Acidovorax sp. NCPPB 4044]MDA8520548.1 DUF2325 domain-containing protein [Acidovorax sp. NCPPB 4044]
MRGLPEPVLDEHCALLAEYGRAQLRCSRDLAAQARRIQDLQAEAVRLRARAIVAETALAYAREDRQRHEEALPGLHRRRALARQVEGLTQRLQGLMREVLHWQWRAAARAAPAPDAAQALPELPRSVVCIARGPRGALVARALGAPEALAATPPGVVPAAPEAEGARDDPAAFEASLRAADFVICQTGCVGHDDYWRVQDHCRRTGKPCVLVDQPQVVHVMRGLARTAVQEPAD